MTQQIESCRLFLHLKKRAYPRSAGENAPAGSGLVDFDCRHDEPNELGLTHEQARHAHDHLVAAELIHPLTAEEERKRGLPAHGPGHEILFVEPVDDLTAATILMSQPEN